MPTKPKKPCRQPGCPELTDKRYCLTHQKKHERGSATSRGYGYKWQKARKQYLKVNPLCVRCIKSGRVTPAKVVDHIIPHRGDQQPFWDVGNWQALCKKCHDRKTRTEDQYQEYGYYPPRAGRNL
ncbi:HNH endonuclease [Alkalihalobacillus oceani]|uniref:HNH endonuclease n=1 Tax=Halalkalibacter oceani TaxID=1653776 RepID=UPI002040D1FE|nr:HNH endonuclease signature motif containing protein [Halalkalibacter oceani]MCM3761049.1 HNH endonuclease [Halalkalibacter oceani]